MTSLRALRLNVITAAALSDSLTLEPGEQLTFDSLKTTSLFDNTSQDSVVFDSFEDGNMSNELGGVWWSRFQKGTNTSPAAIDSPGYNGSRYCAALSASDTAGEVAFYLGVNPGLTLDPWKMRQIVDMSEARALAFSIKGTALPIQYTSHSVFS